MIESITLQRTKKNAIRISLNMDGSIKKKGPGKLRNTGGFWEGKIGPGKLDIQENW